MTDTERLHRLRPDPDPVIIPMEVQHLDRVETIWADRLGAPQDHIDAWLDHVLDEDRITEGFVAVTGGYTLGFAIVTVGDEEYLDEYLAHPDMSVDVWPKTGICETIAVGSEYEGQGLGTELVKQQIKYLEMCGVDGAVALSWHREEHYDSRPLFEKFGFEAVWTRDDFYASLPEDIHCVDCEASCECGATVFKKAAYGGQND